MSFNECNNIMSKYDLNTSSQSNFLNFVFNKISKNTVNRFVDKTSNSVDIVLLNHPCIKVIPLFKNMNKDELSLENEIAQAIKIIKNTCFKYVYFVYPKNSNFNKHIQVKVQQLEEACSDYMVKIIPYSLNDLLTNKRTCDGNSNFLCQ